MQSFYLQRKNGLEARILDYGAILAELSVPLADGERVNVVLGYPQDEDYLVDTSYLGAVVGRYCNRIAGAAFTLDGNSHRLDANEGGNTLHGGSDGYHRRLWQCKHAVAGELQLSMHSPDGDQGFPGNLSLVSRYRLVADNCLEIEFTATCDKATIVSLSNHSYFNLQGKGDILDHCLQLDSSAITPVDRQLIPTGERMAVAGTPFDFNRFRSVGEVLSQSHPQLDRGQGLDHNWLLDGADELRQVAQLYCPQTQLRMTVATNQHAMQVYSGNHLAGSGRYRAHQGICFETQHCPDAPNQPGFPSAVLRPGESYRHTTRFSFDQVPAEAIMAP